MRLKYYISSQAKKQLLNDSIENKVATSQFYNHRCPHLQFNRESTLLTKFPNLKFSSSHFLLRTMYIKVDIIQDTDYIKQKIHAMHAIFVDTRTPLLFI